MTDAGGAPRISVVIPVRNGADDIHRQLDALAAQDVDEPFDVVVADNGSTDNTVAVARRWADRLIQLRIVDAQGPATVAHGRNVGAQQARGQFVLFCDADDRVHPQWVREIAESLEKYDAVGARTLLVDARSTPEAVTGELGLASIHGYLHYALGGNCGIRRDLFLRLGGFDLSYDGGHEEVDFCWRLQEAGGTLGYAPGAVLDYRQRTTLRGLFRQRRRFAASSILLWTRFQEHAELKPVSFSGSLKHAVRAVSRARQLLRQSTRVQYMATAGWVFGVVEGHLRYRLLGAPPARSLMTTIFQR